MAALTASYTSIAADVTAVAYLQCEVTSPGVAEIYVAGSTPTAEGLLLNPGETASGEQLQAIAASGAVYARTFNSGANAAEVRVIAAS